jgi:archaellum component FlaC
MTSTVTDYSELIDVTYPVAGVDNDTQGFRDNFSNIKNALNVADTEISSLQMDVNELTNTVSTLNSLASTTYTERIIVSNTLTISSSTITISDTKDLVSQVSATGKVGPSMAIEGVKSLSISQERTVSTIITGVHGGLSWPYDRSFTVQDARQIELGSTFKFYSTSSSTYTVIDINSTTIYTNAPFDPVSLYTKGGVTVGSTIIFKIAVLAGGIFPGHTPPTSILGDPGDVKGKMVVTTGTVQIAHADYDGVNKIWTNIISPTKMATKPQEGSYNVSGTYVGPVTYDVSTSTQFFHTGPLTSNIIANLKNLPVRPFNINVSIIVQSMSTASTATLSNILLEGNEVPYGIIWTADNPPSTSTGATSYFCKHDFNIIGIAEGASYVLGSRAFYTK